MRFPLIAILLFGCPLPGATIHGSAFDFSDDDFELTTVVAMANSSIGARPTEEQALRYEGIIGQVEVYIEEGRIDRLHPRSDGFDTVLSQRFSDSTHSVHAYVFWEKAESRETIVLMIGSLVSSDAEISDGLYVAVSGTQAAEVKRTLMKIGRHLWFYEDGKDGKFAPVRLSDGLPVGAWQAVLEKAKGAEPGSPSNAS